MDSETPDRSADVARVRVECLAERERVFRGRWPNPEHKRTRACLCALGTCDRCVLAAQSGGAR